MERLWMAAADAEKLGVETGDTVEVSSSEHTGQVEVRVTQRLKPGVVFLPTHYGGDSPYQTRSYQYGISLTDFIPFDVEPGVGSMMSQEVAVSAVSYTHLDVYKRQLRKCSPEERAACEGSRAIDPDVAEVIVKLMAPIAPHWAEELWHAVLGREGSVHTPVSYTHLSVRLGFVSRLRKTPVRNRGWIARSRCAVRRRRCWSRGKAS